MGWFSRVWLVLKEGLWAFFLDDALTHGAAIAFYAITALAPTLYVTALIAGLVFGQEAVGTALAHVLAGSAGPEGAILVRTALHNALIEHGGFWPNAIGFAGLLLTSSGLFGAIQVALNVIWKAHPRSSYFLYFLRDRAISLALVVALGFLLVASTLTAATLSRLGASIRYLLPLSIGGAGAINFALSFVLVAILFASIYKVLPDKPLKWRDVITGAVIGAVLFEIGQFAIGFYLGRSAIGRTYGTAGSLIALLLWLYYSAQIFLLGAELTKSWSHHYGSRQDKAD